MTIARIRHLAKAPIAEALLDIRVQPREDITVEHLLALEDMLRPAYEQRKEKRQNQFQIKVDLTKPDAGHAKISSPVTTGYSFANVDGSRLVQVAREGFTQNFLPKYSDGDDLLTESRKNWESYARVAMPALITRLALRYINRISIPTQEMDFNDYFPEAPRVPAELPQFLANYFSRVTIINPEIGAHAAVAQAFSGEHDETGIQFVLDIDVYIEREYHSGDKEIWEKLAELRKFKNEIFFAHASDKLLELFE